jgi:hypothetical protein
MLRHTKAGDIGEWCRSWLHEIIGMVSSMSVS